MSLEGKRVLVVALVVVVLFTGIPVVVGMPVMDCANCDLGVVVASACLFAVLATVAVVLALLALPLRRRIDLFTDLLAASRLERPPRLA